MEENKEFNLSELGFWGCNSFIKDKTVYTEDDVKEFIKKLKEEIGNDIWFNNMERKSILKFIDKLAGDKLNGK